MLWLSRWCRSVAPPVPQGERYGDGSPSTDLSSISTATDGLKRTVPSTAANALFLDTSPLMELIAEETRRRWGEGESPPGDTLAFATRAGQIGDAQEACRDPRAHARPYPSAAASARRSPVAAGGRRRLSQTSSGCCARGQWRPSLAGSMHEAQAEGITISPFGRRTSTACLVTLPDVGIDPRAAPDADGRGVVLTRLAGQGPQRIRAPDARADRQDLNQAHSRRC